MSSPHLDTLIGAPKSEIDTPALLIDLDIMEANIRKMADFFKSVNADLRPHAKTHKTPIIAHKQIEAGAIGITCAKLGEAEALVHAGIRDVLIANQIIGAAKIARLVNLAGHSEIMVAVDDPYNVAQLSEAAEAKGVTLRILIEVDTGMNRCGTEPGKPTLDLARLVLKSKGLQFEGLMGYEGHTVAIPSFTERKKQTDESVDLLVETKDVLERNGVPVKIMSGGGTGTYAITGAHPDMTEIQAGSYIFMDSTYGDVEGIGDRFASSLTVLTAVVSRPNPSRVVVDAGLKVLAKEFGIPQPAGIAGLEMIGLSEEHGKMTAQGDVNLQPGDKIEIVPTHCCTTVNLHNRYYALRNDTVESIWEITARGRSQ
ncbi:MAG: DSD1 family PLP-dependent enzyme [Candidatus Poribacteria bacterium]|nr:DSD1 family PLP-dependent enzyme [Candidatus Poribacteria bacterium]